MDITMRALATSAAAAVALLLAGCDNTATEEPADAPAQTVPENESSESETGADPSIAETEPAAEQMVPAPDPGDEAMDAGTGY